MSTTYSKVTATNDARAIGRQISYHLQKCKVVHVLKGPEEDGDLFYLQAASIIGDVIKDDSGALKFERGSNSPRKSMKRSEKGITFLYCEKSPEFGGHMNFYDDDELKSICEKKPELGAPEIMIEPYIVGGGLCKSINLKQGEALFFKEGMWFGESAFIGTKSWVWGRVVKKDV